jgi:murein L,D-transpeptidase YcbB/YkuD
VYRIAFFQSAKEKIIGLLKGNERLFIKGDTERIESRDLLQKYYDIFGYDAAWTASDSSKAKFRKMLSEMLNHADSLGLNPADYHADFIAKYDSQSRLPGFNYAHFQDESELVFSDAAISFLFNVAYGKEIRTEFNGVKYHIDSARIMQAYNTIVTTGNWRSVLDTLEPRITQYLVLKERLNAMKTFLRDFPEIDTLNMPDDAGGRIAAAVKLRNYRFTGSGFYRNVDVW